jgi:hypothetical protein
MKIFKQFISAIAIIIIPLVVVPNLVQAQNDKKNKEEQVKSLIQTKGFVFKAQTAIPMKGGVRNLTSDYDITVSNDTLNSYLPYFGQAYAPSDPTQGPLQFTSTKFDYKAIEGKKGGWDITIIPHDTKDVRQLYLSVSRNGYGTLNVNSNNRQPITFNGYITEIMHRK